MQGGSLKSIIHNLETRIQLGSFASTADYKEAVEYLLELKSRVEDET